MKKYYPYLEFRDKIDTFTEIYGDKMIKEGWTIWSEPSKKYDEVYESRDNDIRYVYETITGIKKTNNDYLFADWIGKGKHMKTLKKLLEGYKIIINEDGLITDLGNSKIWTKEND
jgi:hypothetical protein